MTPFSQPKPEAHEWAISQFIQRHYRHFNAATLVESAEAYNAQLAGGGKMFVTLAGAMSTAELGLSLAEMIRQDKIHAITCTGANLEEDVFNLVAHDHYERVSHYRDLTPADEQALLDRHLNRVTDTCIPEEEAMRRIEHAVLVLWQEAQTQGERHFPHEYLYRLLNEERVKAHYQIDPRDSWLVAAAEKNLLLFVPGWEDSTLGNMFVGHCLVGDLNFNVVRSGTEYMGALADWYLQTTMGQSVRSAPNRRSTPNPCPPRAALARHRKAPWGSFKSVAASRAISRSAWCRCSIKIFAWIARVGRTSARSAIPPPVTVAIPARCPMRKSLGASWSRTRPSLSLKATPPSWPRSFSPTCSAGEPRPPQHRQGDGARPADVIWRKDDRAINNHEKKETMQAPAEGSAAA